MTTASIHTAPSYVRPARPSDAAAIGEMQAHSMNALLEALLKRPLSAQAKASLSASQFAAQWENTIRSRTSGSAVYIAYDASRDHAAQSLRLSFAQAAQGTSIQSGIAGFAAGITAESDEGTVFVVTAHALADDHPETAREHGARLLSALADNARKLGSRALYIWLFAGDDISVALMSEAGFAPAGAVQTLDVDGTELSQHLWWAEL